MEAIKLRRATISPRLISPTRWRFQLRTNWQPVLHRRDGSLSPNRLRNDVKSLRVAIGRRGKRRKKRRGKDKAARENDAGTYVALIPATPATTAQDISINLDLVPRRDGNATHVCVYVRVARFQLASIALAAI